MVKIGRQKNRPNTLVSAATVRWRTLAEKVYCIIKILEHTPNEHYLFATYYIDPMPKYTSQIIATYSQKPASVFSRVEALVDAASRADLSNACHMTFNFQSRLPGFWDFSFQVLSTPHELVCFMI